MGTDRKATNTIGLNQAEMDRQGGNWESPADIIHYALAGLRYADAHPSGTPTNPEKTRRWLERALAAMECLEVIQ